MGLGMEVAVAVSIKPQRPITPPYLQVAASTASVGRPGTGLWGGLLGGGGVLRR